MNRSEIRKHVLLVVTCLLLIVSASAQGFVDRRKTLDDSEFVAGDIVKLPTISYQLSKATLQSSSMDSLKLVYAFLDAHPNLVVEIANHSDSRASQMSSTHLTQNRAKVCMDSLVKMGIDPKRLSAKGYESTKPMVPDTMIKKLKSKSEQEKAYAMNRRTEMKIISTSFTK